MGGAGREMEHLDAGRVGAQVDWVDGTIKSPLARAMTLHNGEQRRTSPSARASRNTSRGPDEVPVACREVCGHL